MFLDTGYHTPKKSVVRDDNLQQPERTTMAMGAIVAEDCVDVDRARPSICHCYRVSDIVV